MNTAAQSIAEKYFNKFYAQFKNENCSNTDILSNLLPIFISEISEAWGEDLDFSIATADHLINDSKVIFEVRKDFKSDIHIITENGNVYRVKKVSYKTNDIISDCDIQHLQAITHKYNDIELVERLENMSDLQNLTSDKLESLAAEIISFICEKKTHR